MSPVERKRALKSLFFGSLLTAIVAAADLGNHFVSADRWLGDRRARHFQLFTPAPTDRLLHLDVDETALAAVGSWPWPRSVLGDIVEELGRNEAAVVAFDILFTEEQPSGVQQNEDGSSKVVDHDLNLANSFGRCRETILPCGFSFEQPSGSPARDLLVSLLCEDVGAAPAALKERLAEAGIFDVDPDDILLARRDAVTLLVNREMTRAPIDLERLKQALVPQQSEVQQILDRLIEDEYQTYTSRQSMARFALTAREVIPHLLRAREQQAPLAILANAASRGGFVDYLPLDDGVVRGVPMWVEFGGRLYPQLGLAMACAVLGVEPQRIELQPDRITLPLHGGQKVVIPVYAEDARLQRKVGMFFDVPMFGTADWKTMYDWGRNEKTRQHLPITVIWDLSRSRKAIRENNRIADEASSLIWRIRGVRPSNAFNSYRDNLDELVMRAADIENTLRRSKAWYAALTEKEAASGAEEDRLFVQAYKHLLEVKAAIDIFSEQQAKVRNQIENKAIIIGSVTTGAGDFVPTRIHPKCPGTVVHGAVFNAIMTGELYSYAPVWANVGTALILGMLATGMAAVLSPRLSLICTTVLAVAFLLFNAIVLFDYGNWIVKMAAPVAALGLAWSGITMIRFVVEVTERSRITRRFRTYVDPALVSYVVDHPNESRLEGQVRELTIVYTDIAGFTTLTEKLQERSVGILNEYMSLMIPIIRAHRGYVNKFLGDGIMFFFGAPIENPDHAADAISAVLEMQGKMAVLNERLAQRGLPAISMRAGISTGKVVVGDAGAADACDYTVLGDAANLGARLESANKFFGSRILMSERTLHCAGSGFVSRPLGRLQVVGKSQCIMVSEPLCRADGARPEDLELARLSSEVVELYVSRDFGGCLQAIRRMVGRFGPSKFTSIYEMCCAGDCAEPDFDGRLVLDEK